MSTWYEERRADRAAEARLRQQQRLFEARFRREERRKDREERRADKLQRRRDRAQRRRERAARRKQALTPGAVYRKGTLALVAASALASLPAQIMHFVSISWMLLSLPFALEGAAWVMAAGVAYADERGLPHWVRWLLRALCLTAAGYAAWINYEYGAETAPAVGYGLAAVTLFGPLFFEVRQWVTTLTVDPAEKKRRADAKARAEHEKGRQKTFKKVAERQAQLLLAAPYGSLSREEAWARAWWDIEGAPPSVTAGVIAGRLKAEAAVAGVLAEAEQTPERVAVELLLADLFGPYGGGDGGPSGTSTGKPGDGPRGGTPKARTALGGKGKGPIRSTADTEAPKPLAEADLEAVRKLAEALGGAHRLSARNVREAVGCRNDYAIRLRDAVRAEAAATD